MVSFLKCTEREDYENAAHYLQPTQNKDSKLSQRARELQALLRNSKIDLLSDDANSVGDAGLLPGQIRAGVLEVGSMTADVIMVRVNDPASGRIWLISKETVANIPKLYAQMESEEPSFVDRIVPATLNDRRLLGMSLTQWVGWLLSIPISWLLAGLLDQKFSLRIETKVEQLKFVLDRVQSMLDQHPAIETGTSRVRITNFIGAAFEVELLAYGKTNDWTQFTAVRQDVILKIADIIEVSGARLRHQHN